MTKIRLRILSVLCILFMLAGIVTLTSKNNVAFADVQTQISSFEIIDGASIRNSSPEGMRFIARIKTTEKNALQNATFGIIIYPTENVKGELTHDEGTDVLDIPAVKWIDNNDAVLYEEYKFDSEYSYFTAVVRGSTDTFPEEFYTQCLTARGYVIIGDSDPIYTKTQTERSLSYVARMALVAKQPDTNGVLAKFSESAKLEVKKASFYLNKGETDKIEFLLANALLKHTAENVVITYDVADKNVVTVAEDGTITAIGGGNTAITAVVSLGGIKTQFGFNVRVKEELSDCSVDIVQSKYMGYFNTKGTTIVYEDNATVKGETTSAFHITSTDKAPEGGSPTTCALIVSPELIQKGIDNGYTSIAITYYSDTTRFYTYTVANAGGLKDGSSIKDKTHVFNLDTYKTNGLIIAFNDANATRSPVDVYITSIKFAPYSADVTKELATEVSLNCSNAFTMNNVTAKYENNGVHVTSTSALGTNWQTNKAIFAIPKDVVTTAKSLGYISLTVTFNTKHLVETSAGGTRKGTYNPSGTKTEIYLLDTYAEGIEFNFYSNSGQKADITFTSIRFTDKLDENVITAVQRKSPYYSVDDTISYCSVNNTTLSYKENVKINDNVTANAIQITSTSNLPTAPGGSLTGGTVKYWLNLKPTLLTIATNSGYSKAFITVYTDDQIDVARGNWPAQKKFECRNNSILTPTVIEIDIIAGNYNNGIFLWFGSATGSTANVYITSIAFSK